MQSQQNPEIPWNELQEIIDDSEEIEGRVFILDVFIQELKSSNIKTCTDPTDQLINKTY